MWNCIFETPPDPSCSVCLDEMKLQCLKNKPFKSLTPQGKKDLTKILAQELKAPRRGCGIGAVIGGLKKEK